MKWFYLDVNPEPWAVGPAGVARHNGKLSAYIGRNQQLAAYQDAVREAIGQQELISGKITLRFFFWRNRANYTTQKAQSHRKHEADVTNMQKATEDALQGVLFANDRDVDNIHSVLVDQGPNVPGRIIIGVDQSPPAPDILEDIPTYLFTKQPELKPDRLAWGDSDDPF